MPMAGAVEELIEDALTPLISGAFMSITKGMGGVPMGIAVPMGAILGSRICRFILKST